MYPQSAFYEFKEREWVVVNLDALLAEITLLSHLGRSPFARAIPLPSEADLDWSFAAATEVKQYTRMQFVNVARVVVVAVS